MANDNISIFHSPLRSYFQADLDQIYQQRRICRTSKRWRLLVSPKRQIKPNYSNLIPRLQVLEHAAFTWSRNQFADRVDLLARDFELGDDFGCVFFTYYRYHSDTCVPIISAARIDCTVGFLPVLKVLPISAAETLPACLSHLKTEGNVQVATSTLIKVRT